MNTGAKILLVALLAAAPLAGRHVVLEGRRAVVPLDRAARGRVVAGGRQGQGVPADVAQGDVCDYPLARNLILILVAVGSEALLRFLLEGDQRNYTITLRDLKVNTESD